jgi:hypothetical protein
MDRQNRAPDYKGEASGGSGRILAPLALAAAILALLVVTGVIRPF